MIEIIFILIIVGLGAGILGSLIGVGGGIVMTPVLTYLGFQPYVIASSSLIAVTATSLSSTLTYMKKKYIDYSLGIKLALPAIPGAIIGGFLSSNISIDSFKIYFAILLIIIGTYIFFKDKILNNKTIRIPNFLFYPFFLLGTFAAGIISSLFGIGGGVVFVPLLVLIFKMKMIQATPTSQFSLLLTSITGLATHIIMAHPEYLLGLALAVGSFLGAQLGSRYLHLIKENILTMLLSFSLIIVALNFIYGFIINS